MTREIEWFPRTIIFDNYVHSSEYPVVRWALDSVAVATVATALSVLLGAMARHALARLLLPGLLGVQIVIFSLLTKYLQRNPVGRGVRPRMRSRSLPAGPGGSGP